MKTKTFNLLFVSAFAFMFLIGFANAAITLTSSVTTLPQTSGAFNFTVSSDQNESINLDILSISDGSGKTISFSLSSDQVEIDTVLNKSQIITVDYTVESGFNFEFGGSYSTLLSAIGSISEEKTKSFAFKSSDFCEYSNEGNLKVTIRSVKVTDGFGDNKKWYAFDTIEAEVEIRNSGSDDIEDIVIEWGLYNTNTNKWTIEIDEEDEMDLDSKDKDTITIKFTLDDSLDEDLEDLAKGKYVIYVRATGEIAEGTHEGEDTCASVSAEGELVLEKNFLVFSNLKVPATSQCDSEAHISGDIWNIGSKDQKDVSLRIYNKDLGLDKEINIGTLDSFEDTDFDFIIQLPDDAQEKTHTLTLTLYDRDGEEFTNKEGDESRTTLELKVQGNCAVAKASITAVLESGGQAGQDLVVKAIVINKGKKSASYTLNAAGYTGWASSVSLDKPLVTLNAGQSAEVLLTFKVKKEAIGANLFTLELVSENSLVASQPVQIEITKKKWTLFGDNGLSKDNKYLWGIGLLNLILIILIIVVAVRIARK